MSTALPWDSRADYVQYTTNGEWQPMRCPRQTQMDIPPLYGQYGESHTALLAPHWVRVSTLWTFSISYIQSHIQYNLHISLHPKSLNNIHPAQYLIPCIPSIKHSRTLPE